MACITFSGFWNESQDLERRDELAKKLNEEGYVFDKDHWERYA